ncbi:hypothetical protein GF314_01725 [bacterium]|nr:hypothetical protein [bacterium]
MIRFPRSLASSRSLVALALAAGLTTLTACMVTDDVEPDHPFKGEPGGGDPSTAGTLTGSVSTATGGAAGFVTVRAGERSTFADGQGDFTLRDVPEDVAFLRVSDDPLRNSVVYRPVDIILGASVHYPDLALLDLPIVGTVNGADGGEVFAGPDGTGVVFAGGTLENASGPFTGVCGVLMGASLASDDLFFATFPGPMAGTTDDGDVVTFEPQGVLWLNLIFANQGLWLAEGSTATVRLGLPDGQAATAPETILAWQLVDSTGTWEQIGESVLTDGVYDVEVARLAPVCWAEPIDQVCEVTGTVTDQDGNPLASARVIGRGLGGGIQTDAVSDETGAFTLAVVNDVASELRGYVGNIAGTPDTLAAGTPCPVTLDTPLAVALPDWSITLTWTEADTDLDAHLHVADGSWHLFYIEPGSLDGAPFTRLENDDRTGTVGETIVGQRWYDGTTEFWVHDYEHRDSEQTLETGAMVELAIEDSSWTFDVRDVPFPLAIDEGDTTVADSTGWWHVFDIEVSGRDVEVIAVQRFEDGTTAGRAKHRIVGKPAR